MKEKAKKAVSFLNDLITGMDRGPFWIVGFIILAVNIIPCLYLGQGSIFPYHDQLDETILSYVLNAKYLGKGAEYFPELLGGVNVSGMQPSAVLFIPLYRLFPAFTAFLIQWMVVVASGFFGMYFCVKEIIGSSILAVTAAGIFSMLPTAPIYGLSVAGVPLLLCCFLWLYQGKNKVRSMILILFFGLTTHLVLIGYVVLAFWGAALLYSLRSRESRRKSNWIWAGFICLVLVYIVVNHDLFLELILKKSQYISSREEIVNYPGDFWDMVKNVFLQSGQHAQSLHRYLILPILVILVMGGILYHRFGPDFRKFYRAALGGMVLLGLIALFYGFNKWQPIVEFKNRCTGFLHYFQAERFYWLYPSGWYLEFALCFFLWWHPWDRKMYENPGERVCRDGLLKKMTGAPITKLLILCLVLLPTLQEVKVNSYLYLNVNQINNGSDITGYISWESFYAEDLMEELEEVIGRDMTSYKIVHLGINPTPALMHGFYTADGYSNNYPLEYKHRFRKVIARELEKNEQTRLYFDEWGSRCYLFNGASGNAWMLGKDQQVVYERLDLDMDALKDLGCEYLFSCGEIKNAKELGLEFMGYHTTEKSYWGIWLYRL